MFALAFAFYSGFKPFPWSFKHLSIPSFQVASRENPVTDEYMVTFTVKAVVHAGYTRDDIKLVSEKIIEGLPKHNMAIICFFSNPSELKTNQDFTVARTFWGPEHWDPILKTSRYPLSGDYSANSMKIAMKGETLPGLVVQNY
jgi:hypothetical protein